MEITINGQVLQFNFESWWGPMYLYESIMDIEHHPERTFNPARSLHLHVMLYSILLNDNPGMTLQLDEFCKAIEDLKLYNSILTYYNQRVAVIMDIQTLAAKSDTPGSKKKNLRRTKHTSA